MDELDALVPPISVGPIGFGPKIATALAKAQAAFPAVPKDREVEIRSDKGNYKFAYAPLDTIIDATRKPLADNGLSISQILDAADLHTYLFHESGEYLHGALPVPRGGTIQALGSTITYLRRYALQAMLGIAAEADDDGQAGAAGAAPQGQRPSAGVRGAVDNRLRDTGRPAATASAPRPASATPAAPEAKTDAPEQQGEGGASADDPTTTPTTPVTSGSTAPSPTTSATPPEATNTGADAAGIASSDRSGLTFEEFTKMARERGILTGHAVRAARELWPDGEFKAKEDIAALSDEDRLLVMMKAIDLQA